MSLKILVLSDSVALPRRVPEFTLFKETWPELLKKEGNIIIQCSIGAATSSQIKAQCYYYNAECFEVDVVIVQCGIVDCAPRFLRKGEVDFLKGIPKFGPKVIKTLNNNWVRKFRRISYTSERLFSKNINYIAGAFKTKKVFFIGIIPATSDYEKKLNGITNNINRYNKILEENTNIIRVDGVENHGVMSDFHHLNKEGHFYIYEKIIERLKKEHQLL